MDELCFDDMTRIEAPVKIAGKPHVLKEATEAAATIFKNRMAAGLKMADGKVVGITAVADAESYLLALCLFERTKDGDVPIPRDVIRDWPYRVTKPLLERIKKISRLEEPETAETLQTRIREDQEKLKALQNGHDALAQEKNLPSASTSTSP